MDQILVAIVTEIKAEVVKEDIDLVRLRNLVDFAFRVKEMAIDSVTDIQTISTVSMARPVQQVAYGPSQIERLLAEFLPGAFPILKTKVNNDAISNLVALANSYRDLKDKDPELAAKLKARLETLLVANEDKKEETDETIHPELSRGHTAD